MANFSTKAWAKFTTGFLLAIGFLCKNIQEFDHGALSSDFFGSVNNWMCGRILVLLLVRVSFGIAIPGRERGVKMPHILVTGGDRRRTREIWRVEVCACHSERGLLFVGMVLSCSLRIGLERGRCPNDDHSHTWREWCVRIAREREREPALPLRWTLPLVAASGPCCDFVDGDLKKRSL